MLLTEWVRNVVNNCILKVVEFRKKSGNDSAHQNSKIVIVH